MPAKGMRFWVPAVISRPGLPPFQADVPFHPDGTIADMNFPNLSYKGKQGIFVHGEIFIEEPDVALTLMQNPVNLRFDPRDALKIGISAEKLKELGFDISETDSASAPASVVIEDKPAEPEENFPDFDVMTKQELIDFAGINEINVDIRKNKPELLKDIQKALKKRK